MISAELEADVLASCMTDRSYMMKAARILSVHDFSSSARAWIWSTIMSVWTKHRELPGSALYLKRLGDEVEDEEDRGLYLAELRFLSRRTVIGRDSALEQVKFLVRDARVRRLTVSLIEKLESRDYAGCENLVLDSARASKTVSEDDAPVSWATTSKQRLLVYREANMIFRFPLPSETMNGWLNGGFRVGHQNVLTAATGVGKTTFVTGVGFHALMTTKGVVVHITTEDPRVDVEARYDSRATNIARHRFFSKEGLDSRELKTYDERLEEVLETLGDRIYVQELQPQTKVSAVWSAVDRVRSIHPDAPILLIVDCGDHLAPDGYKGSDQRVSQSLTFFQLKALVQDKTLGDVCGFTTTQAPKKYWGGKRLDDSAVSESVDKARAASCLIGLRESRRSVKTDDEIVTMVLQLLKNRYGGTKGTWVYVSARLSTSYFQDDIVVEVTDGDAPPSLPDSPDQGESCIIVPDSYRPTLTVVKPTLDLDDGTDGMLSELGFGKVKKMEDDPN